MAILAVNEAEGQADETTVTTGNSGGASGTGFDNVNIGTSHEVKFDTAEAAHGTKSYRFSLGATAGGTAFVEWGSTTIGTLTHITGRVYRKGGAPSSNQLLIRALKAGSQRWGIRVTSAGKLVMLDAGNTAQHTFTASLSTSSWDRIEFEIVLSATVGEMHVRLYKTPESTSPDESWDSTATLNLGADMDTIRFGYCAASTNQGPLWLDGLGLDDTQLMGPAQRDFAQGYAPGGATAQATFQAVSTRSRPLRREGLGPVRFMLEGDGGSVALRNVDEWEAIEEVGGGYISSSGVIPDDRLEHAMRKIDQGSVFRAFLHEAEEELFAGPLLAPVEGDWPFANIQADGWGRRFYLETERLLWQTWLTSLFTIGSGSPYFYADMDENFDLSSDGGIITLASIEGQTYANGDRNRMVMASPRSPITRVAGHLQIKSTIVAGGDEDWWEVKLMEDTFPGDTASVVQEFDLSTLNQDFDLECAADQVMFDIRRQDPGTSSGWWARITDLRVNGMAQGDVWFLHNVAADVAHRFGVGDGWIVPSEINVLPLDVINGSPGRALDIACGQADWRWAIRGAGWGPILDVAPWDQRTWIVNPSEAVVSLRTQRRYDRVRVPVFYSTGPEGQGIEDTILVVSDEPFREPVTYPLALEGQPPAEDEARSIGERVLPYLQSKRQAGWVVVATVRNMVGQEVSAYLVRAGDTVILGDLVLRVRRVRRTLTEVELTFDDTDSYVDRVTGERARRLAYQGLIGRG